MFEHAFQRMAMFIPYLHPVWLGSLTRFISFFILKKYKRARCKTLSEFLDNSKKKKMFWKRQLSLLFFLSLPLLQVSFDLSYCVYLFLFLSYSLSLFFFLPLPLLQVCFDLYLSLTRLLCLSLCVCLCESLFHFCSYSLSPTVTSLL